MEFEACVSLSEIKSRSEERISHSGRPGLRFYRSVLVPREAVKWEASLVYIYIKLNTENRLESDTVMSL